MIILFLTLILVAHQSSASSKCTYSKEKGLLIADCAYKKMEEVPEDIRPETEVLDLSGNEFQKLYNSSFSCCTAVQRLYLRNNVMTLIEFGTFARMTNLVALDLSENGAMKALPYLPNNLRKLYLSRIPVLFSPSNMSDPMIEISRLTLLDTLDLSRNRLKQFPKFTGDMYNLVHLNLSDNDISNVTADHLAGLCHLKYLYVDPLPTTDSKEKYCSCLALKNWTVTHNIELKKLPICKPSPKLEFNCDSMPRNSTEEIYRRQCTKKIPHYFVFGIASIVVAIIFFIVSLYAWYSVRWRNRRKANLLKRNDMINEICNNTDPSFHDPQIRLFNPARKETSV